MLSFNIVHALHRTSKYFKIAIIIAETKVFKYSLINKTIREIKMKIFIIKLIKE